ncbi:hypothetical protein NtRootA1_41680 [Arthrobacter sp. NtRootA1]|nr:hypothetical protein NtRootA1_41680 [Arthrobacter sp. NtRootA1]
MNAASATANTNFPVWVGHNVPKLRVQRTQLRDVPVIDNTTGNTGSEKERNVMHVVPRASIN